MPMRTKASYWEDIDMKLQAKRAKGKAQYVIYKVLNLTTGETYVGRHTVRFDAKKTFEENSYFGSGTAVKRWKRAGDKLLKGVLMYSTRTAITRDESEAVDYFRETEGKRLKNKEGWERKRYNSWSR